MLEKPYSIACSLSLDSTQKNSLWEIWNKEFPKQIRYATLAEFDQYMENLRDLRHYLLGDDFQPLQGWSFTFNRDQETWFGLIVDTAFQRRGIGTMLLHHLKANHASLNGWVTDNNKDFKQNGTPYISPLPFYLKNEFIVHPQIRLESNNLSTVKISWVKKVVEISPDIEKGTSINPAWRQTGSEIDQD